MKVWIGVLWEVRLVIHNIHGRLGFWPKGVDAIRRDLSCFPFKVMNWHSRCIFCCITAVFQNGQLRLNEVIRSLVGSGCWSSEKVAARVLRGPALIRSQADIITIHSPVFHARFPIGVKWLDGGLPVRTGLPAFALLHWTGMDCHVDGGKGNGGSFPAGGNIVSGGIVGIWTVLDGFTTLSLIWGAGILNVSVPRLGVWDGVNPAVTKAHVAAIAF